MPNTPSPADLDNIIHALDANDADPSEANRKAVQRLVAEVIGGAFSFDLNEKLDWIAKRGLLDFPYELSGLKEVFAVVRRETERLRAVIVAAEQPIAPIKEERRDRIADAVSYMTKQALLGISVSYKQLFERFGLPKSTLADDEGFRSARAAIREQLKGNRPPKGTKKHGRVEAAYEPRKSE